MEKPDDKLQDVPMQDRPTILQASCYKTELQNVRRHYTHEEKRELKDSVVDCSITNRTKKQEFDEIAKEFNKVFKDNAKNIGRTLDDIKRGYSENDERVYLFDNQDRGMMDAYDANGKYLSSRPLYKEEQQTKIVQLNGTHND